MTINWHLWKKPETGGVIVSLIMLVGFCVFILIKTTSHYSITNDQISLARLNIHLLENQIQAIDHYEKLGLQEAQKFATFKRKKWSEPLTQSRLNQSLYTLQKQANVEFLVIHVNHHDY